MHVAINIFHCHVQLLCRVVLVMHLVSVALLIPSLLEVFNLSPSITLYQFILTSILDLALPALTLYQSTHV